MPKLAGVNIWHDNPPLPEELKVRSQRDSISIGLPQGPEVSFRLMRLPLLTSRTVADVLEHANEADGAGFLVIYRKGSEEARNVLRGAGISYSGWDGRSYIQAPGLFVLRDDRKMPQDHFAEDPSPVDDTKRNPFARRSSRVPRWLLLHPDQPLGVGQLADRVELDASSVSRVLRALEDDAYVHSADEGRSRNFRVQRPQALAEAWLQSWSKRRFGQERWDIGARDAEEAAARVRELGAPSQGTWAVGGLAGAALRRRVVEPSDLLLWVDRAAKQHLADALQPLPARGGKGIVRIALAPDPWTLALATPVGGYPVADLAQLWLDCSSEGERAVEAADAMASLAGWV